MTFCAVILLSTQAPIANAEEVKENKKIEDYKGYYSYVVNSNDQYKLVKLNAIWKKWTYKFVEKKEDTPVAKPAETEVAKPVEKQEAKPAETEAAKPAETQVTESQPVKENTQNVTSSEIDAIEAKVVELTNAERAKYGLSALQIDRPLMAAAREKSQDMKDNNYFSHTSPTWGSPFDRLKALGISYQAAGENIAKGQKTAEEVVTAWMNSEGHRANILDAKFTHIGVGYVKDGNIWTQQFIKK